VYADKLENIVAAVSMLADLHVLLVIVIAAVYGLFIGSIPGLTATMATALLVPFAFFMDPLPALAAIVTMSAMAIFAGDIPAALVRMPGTPATAAYTEDAYRLTQRGEGGTVLVTSMVAASIGGLWGALVLIVAAPVLAEFALQFTSFEYFWLAVLGLTAAVIITRGSPARGAISLFVGMLISTIGIDITLGYPRFTFGSVDLLGGISFIPAMIGLFGLSEVLRSVMGRELAMRTGAIDLRGVFPRVWQTLRRYKRNIPRSGVIGTIIGVLPGSGADIGAWVAYAASKNASREGDRFGKGHIEAIVAAGTANNAGLASAWVPALVFGIPGDTITAITIGVLFMKGLRPGPAIFQEQAPLVYAVYMTFILANLLLLPLGYLAIRYSSLVLRVPRNILMPVILTFCVVGAYAINNSLFDVGIMLVMGVLGFFMERHGLPVAPVVLGIVLGPIVEKNFMFSVIKTEWQFAEFFSRPVSAVLIVLTLTTWFVAFVKPLLDRWRAARP
jgi:putative tricarboxylic transport membrane protein